MTRDQMQQVLDALQAVDALIEHQYTGTREGMSAFQNAADDAYDAIAIMQAALDAPDVESTCEWTKDPDFEMGDTYHSACGELWSFIDGGPAENRVSYCHHCGGKVKLATKDTQ